VTGRTRLNLTLAAGAFTVAAVATLVALREPMEPLTRAALDAARRRWREAGIADYDLTVRMNGSRYEVEVRGHIVTKAMVDGRPPSTADVAAYSVDGLFDTLRLDLDNRDDPAGPFAGRGSSLVMRVRFNAALGYVERYLRSSAGQGRGGAIELIRFTRVYQP